MNGSPFAGTTHVAADTIGRIGPTISFFPLMYPLHLTSCPVSRITVHADPPHVHWSAAVSIIKMEWSWFMILAFLLFLVFFFVLCFFLNAKIHLSWNVWVLHTMEQSCSTCYHLKWGKPKTQIPSKLWWKLGYGKTFLLISHYNIIWYIFPYAVLK